MEGHMRRGGALELENQSPAHFSSGIAIPPDPVWICSSCRRPHLYNPGICTSLFCQAELEKAPDATCAELHQRNYYAKEAVELRQPLRLHAEELSAQTDNQAERTEAVSQYHRRFG